MNINIVCVNAKNIHKAPAAWRLKAYCEQKGLQGICITEANINMPIQHTFDKIFCSKPDVAAFSCYIWNIDYINKLVELTKKLLPQTIIVLGGPEVSFEEDFENYPCADFIITGAGEIAFFELLTKIKNSTMEKKQIIRGSNCGFEHFPSPYTDAYFASFDNELPIQNRLIYFEGSRGCPFCCSYCLSSSFEGVFYIDFQDLKQQIELLVKKGAKTIKFVDRTFNADKKRAIQVLQFISLLDTDCTFHFEVAADLFDEQLLSLIQTMPIGRVQFEIGIQSVDPLVLKAAARKTNIQRALQNIKSLTSFQNCHIHLDLIAGLPLENIAGIKNAVDRCILCQPHMLQLGFLKMLRGAKIRQTDFGAQFADFAPYEILQTSALSYADIMELKKIESIIDKFYNSGAFEHSLKFMLQNFFASPFDFFQALAHFCADPLNLNVSLKRVYTILYDFMAQFCDRKRAAHWIKLDCLRLDSRGLLPDDIAPQRNKALENQYRQESGKRHANIRIEYFEQIDKHILFDYDKKEPLTNKFVCIEI